MAGAAIGTTTAPGTFLAPYVPSPEPMVQRLLELARVGPGDTVYDLGAGDGRIVVAAAQQFGAHAVGIELDDRRFASASARIRDLGLGARAQIVHGDLAAVDVTPATVVTLYQLPAVNDLLRPAFERQLRPGARVVTLDFPIDGWKPSRVVTAHLDDGSRHAVFLYEVGATSKESNVMAGQNQKLAYVSGQTRLELGGVLVGVLRTFEGGDATADVVTEKIGTDNIVHKHLANVTYEDIAISFGAGMSADVYDWMQQTLSGKGPRKDGAIVLTDFNGTEYSRLNFFNGLISEMGFPACDPPSKEAGYFTLKISPEYTTAPAKSSNGTKSSASIGKKAPSVLPANFNFTIGGTAQTTVTAIDALVVKQQIVDEAVGEKHDYGKEPGALDISNLVVTVKDTPTSGMRDWFNDFVIKGNNSRDYTRSGTLEYQSPTRQTLFTLTFSGLGIFKLARMKVDAGKEAPQLLRAEMYCEQISFAAAPSVTSSTGSGAAQGTGTTGGATTDTGNTTGSTPIYVDPSSLPSQYVPGVADKFRIAALAPNVAPVTAQRLGRPLRFRG